MSVVTCGDLRVRTEYFGHRTHVQRSRNGVPVYTARVSGPCAHPHCTNRIEPRDLYVQGDAGRLSRWCLAHTTSTTA